MPSLSPPSLLSSKTSHVKVFSKTTKQSLVEMATPAPIIQILSRNNYEEQHLVSLPNALPLPELAPSSIRIKTSILSLTANNLTYGRVGHLITIWEIHPLPSSIPAEYSDPKKFGRIAAWGYATVIESNVSSNWDSST
jgi:hypothetical protein